MVKEEVRCISVQLITENRKRLKRFRPQQKLQMLKEWELSGNGIEVARKHQIHPHTLYRWRLVRLRGCTHSAVYRQRTIEEVERLKASGVKKTAALRRLGVCRSTYYRRLKSREPAARKPSVPRLTETERQAVIEKKKRHPYLSHRKISGYLPHEGHWINESSCYRILSTLGCVFPQPLREAPWRTVHYEPFAPNQIWREDWTTLSIKGLRHYLLIIIDYFSCYIVA